MFLLPYFVDSIWIFKDSLGKILFKSREKFNYVSAFYGGIARFNLGGRCNFMDECEEGEWGIIDFKGKILIRGLEWISNFVGNLAIFQRNYKFGLIRKDGRIILPAKIDEIIIIDENFIFYRLGDKWGIVNGKGNVIFESQFNSFIKLNDSLFIVTKGGECDIFNRCERSKFGIISKRGKFVVPLRFEAIGEIKDSFVEINYEGFWGLMKLDQKFVIEPKFEDILYFDSLVWFKENNKWGLMDLKKRIIIKPNFSEIIRFGEINFLKFKLDEKWGIISSRGKIISEAKFDNVTFLGDKYFLVEKDGLKGVIDTGGNILIPIRFKDISYNTNKFAFYDGKYWTYKNLKFSYIEILNNVLLAQKDNFFGILDTSGNIVLEFHYDSIRIFENFIFAKTKKYWKIFGSNFVEIVRDVDSFEIQESLLKFRKMNKWGLIDMNGNIISGAIYDYIDKIDENGILRVVKDNKFGLLRFDGELILEPRYKFIYKFYKNVYKVILENSFDYVLVKKL
ncbi:MAG: WG repeat-containing protein [candidate division WOR-3 bacterium]